MEVAVLHPRDCLDDRNNLTSSYRQKKPVNNRHRRSPPRHQSASSKKNNLHQSNNNTVSSQVRILKRREDIGENTSDLATVKPDPRSTRQIGSDPVNIPIQIHRRSSPPPFYAGPATSTSPPPSEVPLPAFFAKKSVSVFKSADATNDLIRILRLDLA